MVHNNRPMQIDAPTATLFAALATFVVGLIAGFIALQQWRVARAKLRLDLFEKRFAHYKSMDEHLGLHLNPDLASRWLTESLSETELLFGAEIANGARELHLWIVAERQAFEGPEGWGAHFEVLDAYHTRAQKFLRSMHPSMSFGSWK